MPDGDDGSNNIVAKVMVFELTDAVPISRTARTLEFGGLLITISMIWLAAVDFSTPELQINPLPIKHSLKVLLNIAYKGDVNRLKISLFNGYPTSD